VKTAAVALAGIVLMVVGLLLYAAADLRLGGYIAFVGFFTSMAAWINAIALARKL
jgi:MFS superfamily sulfate permease-like transporter